MSYNDEDALYEEMDELEEDDVEIRELDIRDGHIRITPESSLNEEDDEESENDTIESLDASDWF